MSMTRLERRSIIVYDPYLAQCPGLSALMSPPSIISPGRSQMSFNSSAWESFHSEKTVGWRNCLAWLWKVVSLIDSSCNAVKNLLMWEKEPPVKQMAAERLMLPAGTLATNGWLVHVRLCPQLVQTWATDTNEPMTCQLTSQLLWHTGQSVKSCAKQSL